METEVREVIIRFYSAALMRTMDANRIIERTFQACPGVGRISFERMSDAERAEAGPTDRGQIVRVLHRCFVYARAGQECQRVESIEAEIERENV